MRFLSTLLFLALSTYTWGQCVEFKRTSRGDTINCVDQQGVKQGMWEVIVPALRGEKGYHEEGRFVNGNKEGTWRVFNTAGDPIAVEQYRWGLKHGTSRYYKLMSLEREESWMAINPNKAYDTIEVQDTRDPSKFEQVVIKNTGSSLQHGTWRYYDPTNRRLVLTEYWHYGQLKQTPPENNANPKNDVKIAVNKSVNADSSSAKIKPKEVLEYEKKNAGKKKSKVRDGRTGG